MATTAELKKRFAENLDRLLKITGLSRKKAAEESGVPYKLVRRLASAGVSRIDERNIENLNKLAALFSIPKVDKFWSQNLIPWLLESNEGQQFVKKFRSELKHFRTEQSKNIEHIDLFLFKLIGNALDGKSQSESVVITEYLNRVLALFESDRAEQFKHLIDDYFELVTCQ